MIQVRFWHTSCRSQLGTVSSQHVYAWKSFIMSTYFIRIILPGVERRDSAVLLGLCPVEYFLILLGVRQCACWSRHDGGVYVLYYSEAKSVTRRMEDGRISERSTRTADKELPESRRTLSRKLPVRRTYTSYSKGSPDLGRLLPVGPWS